MRIVSVMEHELDLETYCELDQSSARREVRKEYRHLSQDVEESADSVELQSFLKKAEDIFSKVRHPREAVCDSAFLLSLARKGTEQALQLKTDSVSFDNTVFMEKVITFMHNGNSCHSRDSVHISKASWNNLAKKCQPFFKTAPVFDFLLGPLVTPMPAKVQRRATQKEKDPDVVEKLTLESVENVDRHEEATTKEVECVLKYLKKATGNGNKPVNFFEFVTNPFSFGQTIENIFHLSFLVKDGRASLELDADDLPVLNLHKQYVEEQGHEVITRKQVVMPLTMDDWKNIVRVYNIAVPVIPTRN